MARMVIVTNTELTSGNANELAEALGALGHEVVRAGSLGEASGDVIFADAPALSAATVAGASAPADTPVVVIASAESAREAIDVVKGGGAYDALRLPGSREEIELAAYRALRCEKLMRENDQL